MKAHRAVVSCSFALCLALAVPGVGLAQQNLLVNPGFESGATGWTEWSSPGGWTTHTFAHDYASGVTIWPPDPYPIAGAATHGQHVGGNNVHGGIYQVVNVTPGSAYRVGGTWSGGIGEGGSQPFDVAWFEVTVYQGAVGAADIDAGPVPAEGDTLIAKREYATGPIVAFGRESFEGTFVASQPQVTLAFKAGKVSPNWQPIAFFHDELVVEELENTIPVSSPLGHLALALLVGAAGAWLALGSRSTT